jgi:hypothetical protein
MKCLMILVAGLFVILAGCVTAEVATVPPTCEKVFLDWYQTLPKGVQPAFSRVKMPNGSVVSVAWVKLDDNPFFFAITRKMVEMVKINPSVEGVALNKVCRTPDSGDFLYADWPFVDYDTEEQAVNAKSIRQTRQP